ncbi:ATP-binding protein [Actinomadura geliboluensis]|uniref:ATP-binding protein n=1 Tax=Actinomadura geliboluensis TaxID=882440 RepID=UPI0036B1A055
MGVKRRPGPGHRRPRRSVPSRHDLVRRFHGKLLGPDPYRGRREPTARRRHGRRAESATRLERAVRTTGLPAAAASTRRSAPELRHAQPPPSHATLVHPGNLPWTRQVSQPPLPATDVEEERPVLTRDPAAIPAGGACVFQLPGDPSAASHARSAVSSTMRQLGFAVDQVDDAKLAVSELATNALTHASSMTRPELWMWARTRPSLELVISVFDGHRNGWPSITHADLLDEHGKGLSIVVALATRTGTSFTRSRLSVSTGKRVWFTLALPAPWSATGRVIAPRFAAHRLSEALAARGIPTTCRSDDTGISVITAGTLHVWVEPKAFCWRDDHGYTRQPLIDLQETAERIVNHHESHASRTST